MATTAASNFRKAHWLLTGSYPDIRNTIHRFAPEARKANQALVDLLGKIGARKKGTPAQIALATSQITILGARYPEVLERTTGL